MTRYQLLAGTAIVAGTALTGSQAMAFDEVRWTWTLDANTTIDQTITTTTELVPSGLAAVEDVQIFIGNLSATSTVSDVVNEQPGTEGGTVDVPLTLTIEGDASATGETNLQANANAVVTDAEDNELAMVSGAIDNAGLDPEGNIGDSTNFVVSVEIPGEGQAFDAVEELPEVISAAAAIANNANIASHVKTDVHDTQILFDADDDSSGSYTIDTLSSTTTTTSATSSSSASASSSESSSSFSSMETYDKAFDLLITGTLAYDKSKDVTATVDLDETLSASGTKSANSTLDADADFSGDFTATANANSSASASLDQSVDVEHHGEDIIDFDVAVAASKDLNVDATADGFFDGEATYEASETHDSSASLDITKAVDLSSNESKVLDVDVSGSLSKSGTWSFEEASSNASSSSTSNSFETSFSTETTTTATNDSKTVVTDGDLFALDTAFGLWGDLLDDGVNTGLATTLSLMVAAAYGGLEQAEISSDSFVDNITNASVDSSALGIGNNKSIEVDAATEGDAMLVADVNQFAYANVNANSAVNGVTVSNYVNLGQLDRALVRSTATAIGNNLSVTVNSPLSPNNGDE